MSEVANLTTFAPFDGLAPQRELAARIARLVPGDGVHRVLSRPWA